MSKIIKNCQKFPKFPKLSKTVKNCHKNCHKCLKGHKSLGSLFSVVKTLIVSGVRPTKQASKGQGHLLSCSGQLKTWHRPDFLTILCINPAQGNFSSGLRVFSQPLVFLHFVFLHQFCVNSPSLWNLIQLDRYFQFSQIDPGLPTFIGICS